MTQTVSVTRHVDRPVDQTRAWMADAHKMLPTVSAFSRCEFVGESDDGPLWDVFMRSGTIYLGGRVVLTSGENPALSWRSLQGTRHSFEAAVEDEGGGSRIKLSLTFSLNGLGTAWFSEMIGRGIVSRNLEAAAEEIRHHLEFGQ